MILNEAVALSPQISAHQQLIQIPETAAARQCSALSVSCRWDRSSVSTPTSRETVLCTSVGSATAGQETNQRWVHMWDLTQERSLSLVLTAHTDLLKKSTLASISDANMEVSYVSSLGCLKLRISTARYFCSKRGADWPNVSALANPRFSLVILPSGKHYYRLLTNNYHVTKYVSECYTVFAPMCFVLTSYASRRPDMRSSITRQCVQALVCFLSTCCKWSVI